MEIFDKRVSSVGCPFEVKLCNRLSFTVTEKNHRIEFTNRKENFWSRYQIARKLSKFSSNHLFFLGRFSVTGISLSRWAFSMQQGLRMERLQAQCSYFLSQMSTGS